MKRKNQKAFTLIELLIVIAIIAVLATVVILSLNPAELLRQSRDSNRLSDMATLKSAISLYLADQSVASLGNAATCYASVVPPFTTFTSTSSATTASTSTCDWTLATPSNTTGTLLRGITGTGWIPIPFNLITSGSPLGQEPVDPSNVTSGGSCAGISCGLFYTYNFSGTSFKTAAFMESTKYASGTAASGNVELNDGGNSPFVYESGSNPAL